MLLGKKNKTMDSEALAAYDKTWQKRFSNMDISQYSMDYIRDAKSIDISDEIVNIYICVCVWKRD